MRLNSIKLSGFKSFAEPTNFMLPGQLVGVVGPNGCGKSNIMDAVRWVLGESKASELRGESMQDVIFNGSGQRKPAGRASVELVFDNSDARAGGPWNQFGEIAVKRVLTRDGGSSYYINNQPVRRRDVQDVFLGTGLGPRAYAIIGQGLGALQKPLLVLALGEVGLQGVVLLRNLGLLFELVQIDRQLAQDVFDTGQVFAGV